MRNAAWLTMVWALVWAVAACHAAAEGGLEIPLDIRLGVRLEIRLEIRLLKDGPSGYAFEVSGWDDRALAAKGLEKAVAVFVVSARSAAGDPPVLGAPELRDRTLVFRPRFPLSPGLRYRVEVNPAAAGLAGAPVVRIFEIPAERLEPATVVEQVYPSASVLPENLLKLYLHFSAPMSRGEAYQRIRLLDDHGRTVEAPFLELDEELWDPQGRRLTVLLDPGRIKRGLVPHQQVGPPLSAGHRYTLVVDSNWRDARGLPLRTEYRKTFSVERPDHSIPALRLWRLAAPRAGTTAPLIVSLPKPLDHGLLGRLLEIRDSSGRVVKGSMAIERQETEWRFVPGKPWRAGSYTLRVDAALEDLAGNRINRPFEVDRFEKVERRPVAEAEELRFRVRP